MVLSFAPMEGVTGAAFRRVHRRLFAGADRYCAPFLAPDAQGRCKQSHWRALLPEANAGLTLLPQILTNSPEAFLCAARALAEIGYHEVNLNAGCPSGTVVSKHKGAGMLGDPAALDRFLEAVFAQTPVHFDAPPNTFTRHESRKCPRCGEFCSEPFLRVVDGEIVCLDCAES